MSDPIKRTKAIFRPGAEAPRLSDHLGLVPIDEGVILEFSYFGGAFRFPNDELEQLATLEPEMVVMNGLPVEIIERIPPHTSILLPKDLLRELRDYLNLMGDSLNEPK